MVAKLSRQEQKETTRTGLIIAAADLFARKGFAATTTAAVAKASGLSHGAIFVHFPRREDLVLAVIDDFGVKLSEEFRKTVAKESGVGGILRAHLNTLAEFEDFYFRIVTESQNLPANLQSMAFMLNSAVSWKLYEAARPLMDAGKFKKIEKPLLFNTWMALLSYYIAHRAQFSTKPSILKEKGEDLVTHFLQLITVKG